MRGRVSVLWSFSLALALHNVYNFVDKGRCLGYWMDDERD